VGSGSLSIHEARIGKSQAICKRLSNFHPRSASFGLLRRQLTWLTTCSTSKQPLLPEINNWPKCSATAKKRDFPCDGAFISGGNYPPERSQRRPAASRSQPLHQCSAANRYLAREAPWESLHLSTWKRTRAWRRCCLRNVSKLPLLSITERHRREGQVPVNAYFC
jgi:hypothetical protein